MASTSEIVHLDVQGLACPLPLLRTRQALTQLTSGQMLQVTGIGKDSLADLQQLCQDKGLRLEVKGEKNDLSSITAMVSKIFF